MPRHPDPTIEAARQEALRRTFAAERYTAQTGQSNQQLWHYADEAWSQLKQLDEAIATETDAAHQRYLRQAHGLD
jgi:hypothetical protein